MSVQMTCPYCKREFPYDNGAIDREISALGQQIRALTTELARIKALQPSARRAKEGSRKVLVLRLSEAQQRIVELKTVRKACDQQIRHYEYEAFKSRVRERFGEEEYRRIIALVADDLKAYRASDLMRHEYTRSNAKANVISVSKL